MSKQVALIFLFLFSMSLYALEKNDRAGKALIAKGDVYYQYKKHSRKIAKDAWIPKKSILNTGKKSFTKVLLLEKSILSLGPESSMKVVAVEKNSVAIVNLIKGKIRAKIEKSKFNTDKTKSKFFLVTKNVALGVRGTDFQVIHDPLADTFNVMTFEGEVIVTKITDGRNPEDLSPDELDEYLNRNGSVTVGPGKSTWTQNELSLPMEPEEIPLTTMKEIFGENYQRKVGKNEINAWEDDPAFQSDGGKDVETNKKIADSDKDKKRPREDAKDEESEKAGENANEKSGKIDDDEYFAEPASPDSKKARSQLRMENKLKKLAEKHKTSIGHIADKVGAFGKNSLRDQLRKLKQGKDELHSEYSGKRISERTSKTKLLQKTQEKYEQFLKEHNIREIINNIMGDDSSTSSNATKTTEKTVSANEKELATFLSKYSYPELKAQLNTGGGNGSLLDALRNSPISAKKVQLKSSSTTDTTTALDPKKDAIQNCVNQGGTLDSCTKVFKSNQLPTFSPPLDLSGGN